MAQTNIQQKFDQLVKTVIYELQYRDRELDKWIRIAENLNDMEDTDMKIILEKNNVYQEMELAKLRLQELPRYGWNNAAAEAEAAAKSSSHGGRHTKRNRTSRRLKRRTKNNRKSRRY